MLGRLGAVVSRHWLVTILLWVALVAGLRWLAPRWDQVTHDGDLAYLPADMPSVQGDELLNRAFPANRAKSQLVIVLARPNQSLTSDDFAAGEALADRCRDPSAELPVREVWTAATDLIGEKLVSRDHQSTLVVLHLDNEFMATDNIRVLARIQKILAEAAPQLPTGLTTGISGSAAIGGDMLSSAAESIKNTELYTVALVVVILLLVYRAPLLVIVPLLTIIVSVSVATQLVALLTQVNRLPGMDWWHFKVFTTTRIFIIVILFGSGTDFCLFLIARYKEELQRGLDKAAAIAAVLGHVGEALVGSALTTICGLSMMYFADFGKFRNSGPAIALCLVVTLLAALTLAPALLRAFGPLVFWPFGIQADRTADKAARNETVARSDRFWGAIGDLTLRWPGTILAASLLLLAPLAWNGTSVAISYDLLNELAADRPSVVGTALLREHFSAGETSPLTVLAYLPGAKFDAGEGKWQIAALTTHLEQLHASDARGQPAPIIASVRSLSQPLGDPPPHGIAALGRKGGLRRLMASDSPQAKTKYVARAPEFAGSVTRFDLVLREEPFSGRAIDSLQQVDRDLQSLAADPGSPWHGCRFYFCGTTAGTRDLKTVIEGDQRRIQQLVVLAVLVVLLIILRQPVVCVYLILSVLFSYFVTIGATQLLFGWIYSGSFYGLDWKVPLYLFVILIAVGEDYNIYLLTRVAEEQRRHGFVEGLRLAVARTGGIITSCGVIMAGTFISMTTGSLRGVAELGFALSLGVLLDTLLVRPVLVPAFLMLLHRHGGDWRRQAPVEARSLLETHSRIVPAGE